MDQDQEHEVYGGEIPEEVGEMEADDYAAAADGQDSQSSKENLEEMKKRLKEMEDEAGALREMQAKVEKEMAAVQEDSSGGAASHAEKEEVDSRSIYVGNVDYACTPEEVQQHFQSCGTVNRVTIKTFAYVEFVEVEAVQNALLLNESELHGRQLKVSAKRTNNPGMKQYRGRRPNPYMAFGSRRPYMPPPFYSPYGYGYEEQAKQRQLEGILNKLRPQNFGKLFQQVIDVNIDNTTTLSGVVAQIFDKALTEPNLCEMYANFCFHLSGVLPDFTENDEKITFKRLLLNNCQEEFERGEREQAEADRVEEEGGIKQSDLEREEKRIKARTRMLGNIRLIGELYKKKMLTERIMHECILKLLGQQENPDEEDLEALCKLMSTIGDQIDHAKAKVHMDAYFDGMKKLSTNQKLSSRVRFMLRDLIDLRKNRWQQRRKVEGPKKIEEVHRDAAQERQNQASRLTRGPNMSSNSRRGPPGDYGPRGSSVLPSPNSQIGGLRGLSTQVRGYAMQDVRLDDHHPLENRTLSLPLTQRPIDDSSITLGPQGGLARGMSIRGQPSISSVPLAENPLGIGDSRRMMSGPNGYNATNDRMPYRPRRDVNLGNMPDRLSETSFDQPTFQDRNVTVGNRGSRVADLSYDRFSPTIFPAGQTLGSLGGNLSVASDAKPLSEEVLREKSISTIREFYSAKDECEVALCIKELNSPSFYPFMVSLWVTDSFERKDMERDLLAMLLVNLTKSQDNLFNELQLTQGFESVLASLEDAVNDAPRAAEFLGRILVKVILENVVPLSEIGKLILEGGEGSGSLLESGLASEVLGSILVIIRIEKGDSKLKAMISSSKLRLEDFKPPHPIKSKKLDAFL